MASLSLKKRVIEKVTNVKSNELLKKIEKLLDDDWAQSLLSPAQQRELERRIAEHKSGKTKFISWASFKKKVEGSNVRKKKTEKPLTLKEFYDRNKKAEKDIKAGRIIDSSKLKAKFSQKN
jgi:putative addiction module component (TIGR02574 family)